MRKMVIGNAKNGRFRVFWPPVMKTQALVGEIYTFPQKPEKLG
jgi:hypothetical protein